MQIFPTGVLLYGIFLIALSRGLPSALIAYGALIPFGAAAVVVVGPLSFLANKLAMMTLCAVWLASYLLRPQGPALPRPEPAVAMWLVFGAYALFTAFAYPRLFQSQVLVISLGGGRDIVPLYPGISSYLTLLAPTSANLSQSFYFLFGVLFFYFAVTVGRKYGPRVLERVLIASATVNASLGMLDLVGLDLFLAVFRTADYAILDAHAILGFDRIIGGYPEASAFGATSAGLAIYAASRYLDTGQRHWGVLAGLNGVLCLGAFSSTGLASLGVGMTILAVRFGVEGLFPRNSPGQLRRNSALFAGGLAVLLLLLQLPAISHWLADYLDTLLFSKSTSISGIERGIWAQEGIRVGLETFCLGAGLGSVRANGLISVWFANLGVPGLAFYGFFLYYLLFLKRGSFPGSEEHSMSRAATVSILTGLVSALASSTTLGTVGLTAAIILTTRSKTKTLSLPSLKSERIPRSFEERTAA